MKKNITVLFSFSLIALSMSGCGLSMNSQAAETETAVTVSIENFSPGASQFQIFKMTVSALVDTPIRYTSPHGDISTTVKRDDSYETIVLTEFKAPVEPGNFQEITVNEYATDGITKGVIGQTNTRTEIRVTNFIEGPIPDGTYDLSQNDSLYIGEVLGQEYTIETGSTETGSTLRDN